MNKDQSVLFICMHNSARSFMAEYIGRSKYPQITFKSAGVHPLGPDPAAVAVLKEDEINTEGHRPCTIGSFSEEYFDMAVFLCPGAMKLAYSFPFAKDVILREFRIPYGEGGQLSVYRELKNNLKIFIDDIVKNIQN